MRHLLMGASVLAIAVSSAGAVMAQSEGEFTLTILHTNDVHARIESINASDATCAAEAEEAGECFGGVARLATAIEERRAANENVLVLDAGDWYQGSLFYTTYKGEETVEFMNWIGYAAMAVGNHEFDDGPEGLAVLLDGAEFPVLSGNIDVNEDEILAGRVPGVAILEVGGERIGIVSAVAEDTDETSSPGDGVRFIRAEDYLKGAVEGLEAAGINKIIALTHMGITRDIDIASAVPGIDIIVGGHSHTLMSNTEDAAYSYPFMVENPLGMEVPIVQAYAYTKYLGEITVTFDADGNVISAEGDPILLDASFEPNAEIAARVAELREPIEELMAEIIGSASADIDGSRESCRITVCEMGVLVTEAMLNHPLSEGIDFVITNGGGLRASIAAGDISMGDVIAVLPFQNTLATFEIDGASVIEALENGVSDWENGAGRFPQVAGLRFTWDRNAPVGERIVSVEVEQDGEWAPIEEDTTYRVATNNYMRNGGDGYAVFAGDDKNAYDYGPGLEIVLADYIASLGGEYTPSVDDRIQEVE